MAADEREAVALVRDRARQRRAAGAFDEASGDDAAVRRVRNRDVSPPEHEQEHAGLEVRDAGVRDALVLAQVRLDQFAHSCK